MGWLRPRRGLRKAKQATHVVSLFPAAAAPAHARNNQRCTNSHAVLNITTAAQQQRKNAPVVPPGRCAVRDCVFEHEVEREADLRGSNNNFMIA